jgi:hypothetical protein
MNGKIASAGIKEICELLCTDSRAATTEKKLVYWKYGVRGFSRNRICP